MRIVTVCLLCLGLALTGCTKLQRGKRAYRHGDYKKAQFLFEQVIKIESSNMEAQTYLLLTRSGLLTDTAASLLKTGNFEAAVPLVEQAIVLDPENEDAKTVLNTSLASLENQIEKELLPKKEWDRVINVADMVLKYKPGEKMLLMERAKAVYMGEKELFNYKSVMAIKKALALNPDDAFLKEKMEAITNQSRPFIVLFKEYQNSLLRENFGQWKGIINARYLHECEVDVGRLKERGEPVNTIQLFFKELSKLPAKYGNPEGADIVCVEPLSADRAYVHFSYRDLPKILKMEISRQGGVLKIDREEDSDIRKAEL
jgi:tetratricopeptide (TPR) repeat protein